ncbi:MAG: DUF3037 domain-containing protein [Cyanosarcina radialis HA8281-LM2]|jgi:hypothetical protein|nr:DUF3037 domain-containing protein [Cyanosarcina radialis HA8281-LM2]
MGSKYSVIQYVPNPVANERINIGVLTFNEHEVRVQFLKNWERVRQFGTEDIEFIQNFEHQMSQAVAAGLMLPGDNRDEPFPERLNRLTRDWLNSIQFTLPRGSLEDVENLLQDIISTYLTEPDTRS